MIGLIINFTMKINIVYTAIFSKSCKSLENLFESMLGGIRQYIDNSLEEMQLQWD